MRRPPSRQRRVLVVDHSAFARSVLGAMIRSQGSFDVVASAVDGEDAIRLALRHRPDLVVMDLELPRVGGLGFLRWLMKHQPVPVLVVTGAGGGREMLRALELGAVDYVLKPTLHASEQLFEIRDELLHKLEDLAVTETDGEGGIHPAARPAPAPAPKASRPSVAVEGGGAPPLVVVGASTGGPPALQHLLSKLPAEWPAAVVVAQHMPAMFTAIFAERLDKVVGLEVAEAKDGDEVLPGRCLILPGGQQGILRGAGGRIFVRLREREEKERYCPSVDLLLESAAEAAGSRVTAVVLTGMGDDGARGIQRVREKGGRTIAEASQTAVVFGMPQAAIRTGAVEAVLPLQEIPERLRREAETPEETPAGGGNSRRGER